ncbi:nucleoside hydrolase [Pedobacter helvus]|uniref:Nucleoside hydrolase n=1 Tax=Pedobacter helvus TaxID=2563444 RepID=A0ABW9JPU9_9SPHI|nr:nucleoside hydrolase [Pedobacter ureilyticus]
MKIFKLAFVLLFCAITVYGVNKRPLTVIFDTDMGNDVDDVLALDMLYKYQDANMINLAAIINNKGNAYAVPFLHLMNQWYGYHNIPLGNVVHSPVKEGKKTYYVEHVYNLKNTANAFVFSTYRNEIETQDAVMLYRKMLAAQPDHSVVIISVGFSTNLSRLMSSEADQYSELRGADLVKRKVKFLSLMGGDFRDNRKPEFNIRLDVRSAKDVLENWPGKIYVSPWELGGAVKFSGEVVAKELNYTSKENPLVKAYEYYLPMPYDREVWDLTSVLYAIEPSSKYFTTSKAGKITVDEKGNTFFQKDKKGERYILSANAKQLQQMKTRMEELVKQKPKNI